MVSQCRRQYRWLLPALLVLPVSLPALAQQVNPASLQACASITGDAQRLACYDQLAGRKPRAAAAKGTRAPAQPQAQPAPHAAAQPPATGLMADLRGYLHRGDQYLHQGGEPDRTSLLDSRWELARASKLGTFNIRGYKPVFIEPVFATNHVNQTPTSPSHSNVVAEPIGLDSVEAKFQISFKTKLVQGLFDGHGDIWAAYTQSSRWQVYNPRLSRPFRETNYEPEAMLVFGTNVPLLGWHLRMLGIGANHQSNGRGKPLSRSWNRVIARIGLERPGWTVMLRPWLRISEDKSKDDNPDITDYLGHGDLNIVHEWHGQEFRLMLRHNFTTHRGAGRFTWSFPVGRGADGYLEVFNGYGESLIDYNHRATYLGIGVSLINWY